MEEHSQLYSYFVMRWTTGTITIEKLQNAVSKGYITQLEYDEIIMMPQG